MAANLLVRSQVDHEPQLLRGSLLCLGSVALLHPVAAESEEGQVALVPFQISAVLVQQFQAGLIQQFETRVGEGSVDGINATGWGVGVRTVGRPRQCMVRAVCVDAQGAQRNLRCGRDQGGEWALPLLGSGRGQLCAPRLLLKGLRRQQGG